MNSENKNTPQCVGFIMDGNRRWAEAHGLPSLEGHRAGYEALKRTIDVAYTRHIPHLVYYAFSTENWKRTEEEVGYLMKLLKSALSELPDIMKRDGKDVAVRVIGERDRLSQELREEIARVEALGSATAALTVWTAISYGGRAEIVDAANRAVLRGEKVTEESFAELLWTAGMPDPDLIIRTSGEKRISNFLLWQAAYSEFFFIDTSWPDFGKAAFEGILEEYGTRQRRKGA